jgi:formylglycine-generating enzyme required for sulfatase activity
MPEDQSLNYNSNYGRALPVGSFPEGKSFYGALDMSGNVWEWVADYYQSNYYQLAPDKNPSGPSSGEGCIQRGGGWGSMKATELIYVTTKYRRWNYPLISNDTLGFRCASDK